MGTRKPVGDRILSHYSFLKKLVSTKSEKKRRTLLQQASADQILAIVECAANILSWKFRLSGPQKRRLLPFAQQVRRLARVRSEKSARRLVQTGGALPIGALLAPVLAEATYHLIRKFTSKGDGTDS